jgi:predicted nucleic acid-binding Zn ribbon protein
VLNDKIESMQPLSSALPGALAELLRGAPLSPGKVAFAWRAAVGPALERETSVRLEDGTLIVDAATRQWATEIRRASSTILRRMETLLGPDTIKGLTVRERRT